MQESGNFNEFLRKGPKGAKNCKFQAWSGGKACQFCGARPVVAKIGFDTDENEPPKVGGELFIIHY